MPHVDKRTLSCFVNNTCDAACVYCYAKSEQTQRKVLDPAFAKKAIDDYFQADHHQLRFFGAGEPTLDLDLIKELRQYAARKVGERLVTEIQTNAYFDAQTAQWVGENITNVWVSWDGPPSIQNSQRPKKGNMEPAAILERNVSIMVECKKNGAPGFVGARATITKRSFEIQKDLIDYWAGFGIKAIYSTPICMPLSDSEAKYPDAYGPIDMIAYAENFLHGYRYAQQLGIFFGSFLIINFDRGSCYHCRACLPTPHLTYDGYVSCCDMAMSMAGNPHMHSLIYGRWIPQEQRIEYFRWKMEVIRTRVAQNIRECRGCDLSSHCAGGCLGEALNETRDFYGRKKDVCEATKFIARKLPIGTLQIPFLHP